MSSSYYVGIINKNKNGFYEINKPIYITGIEMSFVSTLLERSGINIEEDFVYACSDSFKPVLYSIDTNWDGPFSDKYMDCYCESIPFFKIRKEQYPLICDEEERNGLKIGIIENEIKCTSSENLKKFKEINTSHETIREIMKDDSYYQNNNSDDFVEEVISHYLKIREWIKSKREVYVYCDY